MKLSKRAIDALGGVQQETLIWDEDLPGFGLRCWPSGRRVFFVQYRVGGGRNGTQRRLRLGVYGVITLDKARVEAKKILARAALGEDPVAAKNARKKPTLFNDLLGLWEREGLPTSRRTGARRSARNLANEMGMVEAHLRPLMGAVELSKITRADIERVRRAIADGKTSALKHGKLRGRIRVRGGDGTAVRTIRLLSSILSFAEERGMIAVNPARGVKLATSMKIERFLSHDEMRRLGETLRALQPTRGLEIAAKAVELLLLTGARRQEIVGLRWEEVDLEFGMLRLKTSKTGQKTILLPAPALARLREWRDEADRDLIWVFPSTRTDGHFDGVGRAWDRFRHQAGLKGVRLHDLRHTFASVGASSGIGLPLIGGLLGHSQASTTQRYAHLADNPLRTAADKIGSEIAKALGEDN